MDPKELEPPVTEEEKSAAAAEQPTPEAPVEAKQEEKAETEEKKDPSTRNVAHGAFHEERERRKSAERELHELRRNQEVLHNRFSQLLQTVQNPPPQIPSEDQDPITNHAARLRQQEEMSRQLMESMGRQQQREQAEAQARAFANHVNALEAEYVQEKADYHEALNFARSQRAKELKALGYGAEQIPAILHNNAMEIAWVAMQQGRNPASAVYEAALAMGYQPKSKLAEQKIETLQKGTQAAKSLGNGTAPAGPPTPEMIADMSEEDFAAYKASLKGQRLSGVIAKH